MPRPARRAGERPGRGACHEHEEPQLLSVDVELYRRQERFTGTSLADCLDYDRLYDHITEEWPARAHVELLERLAEDWPSMPGERGSRPAA